MRRARPPEVRPSRFGPWRSLSETQLTLQFSLSATYGSHALGVMGLAAGLAAAAIAANPSDPLTTAVAALLGAVVS